MRTLAGHKLDSLGLEPKGMSWAGRKAGWTSEELGRGCEHDQNTLYQSLK